MLLLLDFSLDRCNAAAVREVGDITSAEGFDHALEFRIEPGNASIVRGVCAIPPFALENVDRVVRPVSSDGFQLCEFPSIVDELAQGDACDSFSGFRDCVHFVFVWLGLLALAHYAITIPKRLAIARGVFTFLPILCKSLAGLQ